MILTKILLALVASQQIDRDTIPVPGTTTKITLVKLPGGEFRPEVSGRQILLRSFGIAAYEVTWQEFNHFLDTFPGNDGYGIDFIAQIVPKDVRITEMMKPDHPAVGMTWQLAIAYCGWLSDVTGSYIRLPTEVEWEYSLRGSGDFPKYDDGFGWHQKNSGGGTQAVGLKKPNSFGLYDMLGNAWEYVLEPGSLPTYSPILRGGSWDSPAGSDTATLAQTILSEWIEADPRRPLSTRWLIGPRPSQGMRLVCLVGPEDRDQRKRYRESLEVRVTAVQPRVEVKIGGFSLRYSKVSGEVKNIGDRIVDDVEVQVYPVDAQGRPHLMDTEEPSVGRLTWGKVWPVLSSSSLEGDRRKHLKPGGVRAFEVMLPATFADEEEVPAKTFGGRATNLRFVP